MWNGHEPDADMLATWIKHSPSMKMATGLDGTIYWANDAFCDWSGYTLGELKRMTWMDLSVKDASLEADIAEAKTLDAYKMSYTVTKQYIPKNDKPQWGRLTVVRYPQHGEIKVCLCTWDVVKNGAATALSVAVEAVTKLEARVDTMAGQLKSMQEQTDVDRWVLSTMRMAQKYPKVAAAVFTTAVLIVLGNNGIGFLQRVGLLPLPTLHTESSAGERGSADVDAIGQVLHADGIVNPQPSLTMHYGDRVKVEWMRPTRQPIFDKGRDL